ncbi:MAG: aminotransferase class I/II-fold pyridoxal phosphate-dependent enzyme [Betaproteobacteria bacterium]|nr:MAG: aminotransferase class I/II-fold pyridoxal phosphate-dependent enzyme [Betaproteobacteria bacterium]
MTLQKLQSFLEDHVAGLHAKGVAKGDEKIIVGLRPAEDGFSERYLLDGYGDRAFLRMNSNSYLGLSLHPRVIEAEARAAELFGTGPGAVRFISGTYAQHIELEGELAEFHGRESAMVMSAAYATVIGVLPQLITRDTLVVSDALNHNCIINAIRLSQPADKVVYRHLDLKELDAALAKASGKVKRVCVVTDGVFSMRGDYAPLAEIAAICERHEPAFAEGIMTVVDDSHGVGAFGANGRGTEEQTGGRADILIGTLGKAFGVNGGYVVADAAMIDYLRETSPTYIYSNPITPAEAAAAAESIRILEGAEGRQRLTNLSQRSDQLRTGLTGLGYETIAGDHPIVPIMIRDTEKTSALVAHLFENNILVTGLNYPVVPKGDEEIRLQVSAVHTEGDVGFFLDALRSFH